MYRHIHKQYTPFNGCSSSPKVKEVTFATEGVVTAMGFDPLPSTSHPGCVAGKLFSCCMDDTAPAVRSVVTRIVSK